MNRTSWIFIIATAVICLGIGYFFTKDNVIKAWKIYQETKIAKDDLTQVSKKKEVLTALSKNDQLNGLYDIATKYIPEDGNTSELVIGISALASGSKLNVDQLTFDAAPAAAAKADTTETSATATTDTSATDTTKTSSSGGVKELTFSMTISGTFTDFLNFLKNTETSSRLITFTKMSFSQSETAFSAQLSGIAYWKKGNTLETTLDNIKISQATIDKFQNLKSYGTPINLPTESGFGRTNPFDAVP